MNCYESLMLLNAFDLFCIVLRWFDGLWNVCESKLLTVDLRWFETPLASPLSHLRPTHALSFCNHALHMLCAGTQGPEAAHEEIGGRFGMIRVSVEKSSMRSIQMDKGWHRVNACSFILSRFLRDALEVQDLVSQTWLLKALQVDLRGAEQPNTFQTDVIQWYSMQFIVSLPWKSLPIESHWCP